MDSYTEIGFDSKGRVEVIRKAPSLGVHQRFTPENVGNAVKCFLMHVYTAFNSVHPDHPDSPLTVCDICGRIICDGHIGEGFQ